MLRCVWQSAHFEEKQAPCVLKLDDENHVRLDTFKMYINGSDE